MNYYKLAFKRWKDFGGRSTRREYFMFSLFSIIIFTILEFISTFILVGEIHSYVNNYSDTISNPFPFFSSFGILVILYGLISIIPGIAIYVRRIRDTGISERLIIPVIMAGVISYFISFLGLIVNIGIFILVCLPTDYWEYQKSKQKNREVFVENGEVIKEDFVENRDVTTLEHSEEKVEEGEFIKSQSEPVDISPEPSNMIDRNATEVVGEKEKSSSKFLFLCGGIIVIILLLVYYGQQNSNRNYSTYYSESSSTSSYSYNNFDESSSTDFDDREVVDISDSDKQVLTIVATDIDGRKMEAELTIYNKWIRGDSGENVNIWYTFGGDSYNPPTLFADSSTVAYAIGELKLRNITSEFSGASFNAGEARIKLSYNSTGSKNIAYGAEYRDGFSEYDGYLVSADISKLTNSDHTTWGPVPIIIEMENAYTPNHPDGVPELESTVFTIQFESQAGTRSEEVSFVLQKNAPRSHLSKTSTSSTDTTVSSQTSDTKDLQKEMENLILRFRENINQSVINREDYISDFFASSTNPLYQRLKEIYTKDVIEEGIAYYDMKGGPLYDLRVSGDHIYFKTEYSVVVHYTDGRTSDLITKTRDWTVEKKDGKYYILDFSPL